MAFKLDADFLDPSTTDILEEKLKAILVESVQGDWNYTKMAMGVMKRHTILRGVIDTVHVIFLPHCLSEKLAADFVGQVERRVESVLEKVGNTACVEVFVANENVTELPMNANGRDWSILMHAPSGDETASLAKVSDFISEQSSRTLSLLVGWKHLERIETDAYKQVLKCTIEATSESPELFEFNFSED
jgi:hypothetical protein